MTRTSRQTSAIILDPGKQKTSADETFTNDERGRAYLISNDDAIMRTMQPQNKIRNHHAQLHVFVTFQQH